MKRGTIHIPGSRADELIAQIEQLKAEALKQLGELERPITGGKVRPGGWRHDPLGWLKRYK